MPTSRTPLRRPPHVARLPLLAVLLCAIALAGCGEPLERRFSLSTDGPARAGMLPVPMGAVLANELGRVLRLTTDGDVLWRGTLPQGVAALPAAARSTVVIATRGNLWVGLALEDGKERWRRTDQPAVLTGLTTDGARVFLLGTDGVVHAVDPTTGEDRWQQRVHPATVPAQRFAAPQVAGGRLFVPMGPAGVKVLDAERGAVLATWPVDALGLCADDARVYAAIARGEVRAWDLVAGREKWNRALGSAVTGGCSLAHGKLWVGVEPHTLRSLLPYNGVDQLFAELPGPSEGPVAELGGGLLVPTGGPEGRLAVIDLSHPLPALAAQVRLDSPLRTAPLVNGDQLLVLTADGRALGLIWRSPASPGAGRRP